MVKARNADSEKHPKCIHPIAQIRKLLTFFNLENTHTHTTLKSFVSNAVELDSSVLWVTERHEVV